MSVAEWPAFAPNQRIHDSADAMLMEQLDFLAWAVGFWLRFDEIKRRQGVCYALTVVAHDMGLTWEEAQAYQRGMTAGYEAAMRIYRPRSDG